MAISKTEGKRYVGVIVGGGDKDPDPKKMGRVRVAVPQLMTPGINVKDLPWISLASQPKDQGHQAFDRPPQEGTLVSIYFPPGSKSSGRGIVEFVYNGIHDPKDISGNEPLFNQGWFKAATAVKPDINGFVKSNQTSESNDTGKEKITTNVENKPPTSMDDRKGIPSQLAATSLVTAYDKVTSVATAVQHAAAAMTPALGASLPGIPIDISSIVSQITGGLGTNDLNNGLKNLTSIMMESNPLSGTNFAQTGTRVDPSAFASQIQSAMSSVTNFQQLDDALKDIINNPDVSSLANTVMTIAGPFGDISQIIDKEGNITLSVDSIVQQAMSAFSSLLGGIQSATGPLLGNSEILSDSFNRLPVEVQSAFKQAVGDNIPAKIGNSLSKGKAYLG